MSSSDQDPDSIKLSICLSLNGEMIPLLWSKDFFDELVGKNKKVSVTYVVSDKTQSEFPTGYIQENISACDFNNADVYMCGQGIACKALEESIRATNPQNCNFFIEDFH